MPELFLIRHAQASFGAANYDKLSDLGHEQSEELGRALKAQGVTPTSFWAGTLTRHRETLDGILRGMGASAAPQTHAGFNEFDFTALLNAKYAEQPAPENMHTERKSHFRTLRDTVLEWERDDIPNPPESWADFTNRTRHAMRTAMDPDQQTVLAVSSGGAIGRIVADTLDCPPGQQIKLQLQTRNCSVTRFVYSARTTYLTGFNETPHINAANQERLLTYS
ncbi:histidine phosphatase family protein [Alisedimentitalea sp. MJ-SS2]|uniref:histidine phosphatase family protein n=1 Tax=Aliisedimentitalea sp. MJ-SS2 TaxID=3049795 RepID=UPI00290DAE96|nr:histidine phosphatase family protein [Alisedimentitalea sp. MJ-SS2]MDU8928132.1 histidine phosphatase family protein [Alisedimentitalea sp. MJ-SS2]